MVGDYGEVGWFWVCLRLPVKKDKDARDGASEGESKIDWVTEELASN